VPPCLGVSVISGWGPASGVLTGNRYVGSWKLEVAASFYTSEN